MEEIMNELNTIKVYSLLAAKNVLTLDDVAVLTGLSKSHLYKLTFMRKIPYYKPYGKLIYFDRSEVEAWMKKGRILTADEAEQQAAAHIVARQMTAARKGGQR